MQCPECQSTHVNKNGHKKGKQNLGRLKRKTLCYSKSEQMLRHSIRLLIHAS